MAREEALCLDNFMGDTKYVFALYENRNTLFERYRFGAHNAEICSTPFSMGDKRILHCQYGD